MRDMLERPFYTQFAWAYDLIITAPVSKRCDFVVKLLTGRGVSGGSRLLDAGCGTGSYAVELARRGFLVTGIDMSRDLVRVAEAKAAEESLPLVFNVGNILNLPDDMVFDAVLCRGVLNDLVDEESRRQVFRSFARVLREGGVLILDVREWNVSARRKLKEPVFEKTIETKQGKLTFRSLTRLNKYTQSLEVKETHALECDTDMQMYEYDFTMRCWTNEELSECLVDGGFGSLQWFGDYDLTSSMGSTDRIVVVASHTVMA